MSKLIFNLKLLENDSQISQNILIALLPEIKAYFLKISKNLKEDIANTLVNSIISEPEYSSLLGGTLKGEFGIPNPESRLLEIIETIKNGGSVKIQEPKISGKSIKGSIKIEMIKRDFSDLLSLGGASLTTEKGTVLNWLQWLLLEGDSVIISDYQFVAGNSPSSRTGLGIMKGSGVWRVPPEFAGNIRNNWITRAIDKSIPQIETIISRRLNI